LELPSPEIQESYNYVAGGLTAQNVCLARPGRLVPQLQQGRHGQGVQAPPPAASPLRPNHRLPRVTRTSSHPAHAHCTSCGRESVKTVAASAVRSISACLFRKTGSETKGIRFDRFWRQYCTSCRRENEQDTRKFYELKDQLSWVSTPSRFHHRIWQVEQEICDLGSKLGNGVLNCVVTSTALFLISPIPSLSSLGLSLCSQPMHSRSSTIDRSPSGPTCQRATHQRSLDVTSSSTLPRQLGGLQSPGFFLVGKLSRSPLPIPE
jgi:hypothetical protein